MSKLNIIKRVVTRLFRAIRAFCLAGRRFAIAPGAASHRLSEFADPFVVGELIFTRLDIRAASGFTVNEGTVRRYDGRFVCLSLSLSLFFFLYGALHFRHGCTAAV